MKLINKNKKNKGFTLIEIIVVLVIMVIMAAIAVPAVTGYIKDARNSQYVTEAHSIYTVVQAEEAKAKAKDATINYTTIADTVEQKLAENNITNLTITKSGSVYTFSYKNGTQNVETKFEPNSDDITVTTSKAN